MSQSDILRTVAVYIRADIHLRDRGYSQPIYRIKMIAKERLLKHLEHQGISMKDIDLTKIET